MAYKAKVVSPQKTGGHTWTTEDAQAQTSIQNLIKAPTLSPGRGERALDEDNSDNELIVPVLGLTPSSRWEVQVARTGISDDPVPAHSSSLNASNTTLCSKNTKKNI